MLKAKIKQAAQAILDARALYPDSSLADHDQLATPLALCKVHQSNDRAVMQAYDSPMKDMTEPYCVAKLMKMYQTVVTKQKIYAVKIRRSASKN